jgi:hypothetical protein
MLSLQYDLLPNWNTAYRNQANVPFQQTHYGRLLGIYYLKFTEE